MFRLEFRDAEYTKGGVPLFFYKSAFLRVPGSDGTLLLKGLLRGIHAGHPPSEVRPVDRFPFIAGVLRMKPSGRFAPRPWVDWTLMDLAFRSGGQFCDVFLNINAVTGEAVLWLDRTRATDADVRCVADQFAAIFF